MNIKYNALSTALLLTLSFSIFGSEKDNKANSSVPVIPGQAQVLPHNHPINRKEMKELALLRLTYLRDVAKTITPERFNEIMDTMKDW